MWAASQTEKMVIDPPLLAELPVPVNELIQEIPPYLTPLYNALQSRSTIRRASLKKTFFSAKTFSFALLLLLWKN